MERDVIAVLTQDHREVAAMFAELESALAGPELPASRNGQIRQTLDRVITELVRHSIAEEEFVYPEARRSLPSGAELVDRELAEHTQAEQTMRDLDGMDSGDPRLPELVTRLMAQIREHVAEEEGELFPQLRAAVGQERLDELGRDVEAAKSTAPTHPHPAAPHTPPLNMVAGAGAALVDRVRDALSGRET